MEEHKSFDKDEMMGFNDEKKETKDQYIWSYIIRPVRKGFK